MTDGAQPFLPTGTPGTSEQEDIYSRLREVDWTFASAKTREGVHGLHPYPAKFIPQIPRTLIEHLHPGRGGVVMDPFCGSGTTLVEAQSHGLRSVGVDLHPLACLISRVKTTPLASQNVLRAGREVAHRARDVGSAIPDIPKLDHWFAADVQQALSELTAALSAQPDSPTKDALSVALSAIIVRVSRQDSDTRYAAVENNVTYDDVFRLFDAAVAQLATAVDDAGRPNSTIIHRNILETTADDVGSKVDLVITSPPYPNAYEYWLYHKYRMYWLGMDPLHVRKHEIGARPHYFRKKPATAEDFERQMKSVFELLDSIVVPGGHVCFQVGDSKIHGAIVDNAALVTRAASSFRFSRQLVLERSIPRTRTAFNPKNARIREEKIVVFKRVQR